MRYGNIFIMSVTLMDFITALLILTNPHPLLVARLGIFYEIFRNPYLGALCMLGAVVTTLFAVSLPNKQWRFLLFIPQIFFMFMTTGSAVDYILMQHYADGVIRSWPFILQDQLPTIILTFGYFFAIIDFEKRKPV